MGLRTHGDRAFFGRLSLGSSTEIVDAPPPLIPAISRVETHWAMWSMIPMLASVKA